MRVALALLLFAGLASSALGQAQSGLQANSPSNAPGNSTRGNGNDGAKQRGTWDEPLRFTSRAKDACSMAVGSRGDFTKLRVACRGKARSYWCDFLGKPNLCRAYNANPRHYFTQMLWDLRKLPHACQGARQYKPAMCRGAGDEARMVFHAAWPKVAGVTPRPAQPSPAKPQVKPSSTTKPPVQKPKPQPAKPAAKPAKPVPAAKPVPKKPTVKPGRPGTTPMPGNGQTEGKSTKLAQEYCWKSFQGVCSYVISWFQN